MLIASKAMPRAFKSAFARSHHGHQVVEYTVTDVIGMENVPVRSTIPETRATTGSGTQRAGLTPNVADLSPSIADRPQSQQACRSRRPETPVQATVSPWLRGERGGTD